MVRYYMSPAHRRLARLAQEGQCPDVYIPLDVIEEEGSYIINAFVPGVKAEDVKIEVMEDVLSISGEFPYDQDEEAHYLLREQPRGDFCRKLRLPKLINAAKAEAEVVNGVLTVKVPVAEEAKTKQIKIKVK